MKQTIRSHIFRGRRWLILPESKAPPNTLGFCEDWNLGMRLRRVFIPMDGDAPHDLDTIIHESLHACTELDETAVSETATSIAELLWRLGWRKQD